MRILSLFTRMFVLLLSERVIASQLPLVVWHGINDHCGGFAGDLIDKLKGHVPDLYVHCVTISPTGSGSDEKRRSIFMDTRHQLEIACENVNKDERLKNGFNAFGISQGGLLLRALIEKCPPSEVNHVVTFSSPHQGIFGVPHCFRAVEATVCQWITYLLSFAAYSEAVQRAFVPAQYWHDPRRVNTYRRRSSFLAFFNNERNFNETFKTNFLKVKKLVLARNLNDEMLVPRETAHFGFYSEGRARTVVNFTGTHLYLEDTIGLRELVSNGKVVFEELAGRHMAYDDEWLEHIATEYFKNSN